MKTEGKKNKHRTCWSAGSIHVLSICCTFILQEGLSGSEDSTLESEKGPFSALVFNEHMANSTTRIAPHLELQENMTVTA